MSKQEKTYRGRLHDLLEETLDYYRYSNRGVTKGGSCNYETPDGAMCAAGRLMKKAARRCIIFQGQNGASIVSLLDIGNQNYMGKEILKKRYRDIEPHFLSTLQNLHDEDWYWVKTDAGWKLSPDGQLKAGAIRDEIDEGKYGGGVS